MALQLNDYSALGEFQTPADTVTFIYRKKSTPDQRRVALGDLAWMGQLLLTPTILALPSSLRTPVVANTDPGGVVAPTSLTLTGTPHAITLSTPATAKPSILSLRLAEAGEMVVSHGALPRVTMRRVQPRYEAVLLAACDTFEAPR